jgi:hypothetical protein
LVGLPPGKLLAEVHHRPRPLVFEALLLEGVGPGLRVSRLEDVLEVIDPVAGPPVVTSADVAEETALSRDSARRKL